MNSTPLLRDEDKRPDDTCADGTRAAQLAKLTSWAQPQIYKMTNKMSAGREIYDAINGVVRLKRGFELLERTGMDAFFVGNLLALQGLTTAKDNWRASLCCRTSSFRQATPCQV